jgi:hypothetical protein
LSMPPQTVEGAAFVKALTDLTTGIEAACTAGDALVDALLPFASDPEGGEQVVKTMRSLLDKLQQSHRALFLYELTAMMADIQLDACRAKAAPKTPVPVAFNDVQF